MKKLKLIWKILFGRGRYAVIIYDYRNLPAEGDTLRVGHMLATFVETDTLEIGGNLITFVGEELKPGEVDIAAKEMYDSPIQQMAPITKHIEYLRDLQEEQLKTSITPVFLPEGMKLVSDWLLVTIEYEEELKKEFCTNCPNTCKSHGGNSQFCTAVDCICHKTY